MRVYLVTYDITQPKRLRRVHRTLRAWGDAVQYSVFRCDLGEADYIRLKTLLSDIIHHTLDQVLFIDLGIVGGKREAQIKALGRPYDVVERSAIVV